MDLSAAAAIITAVAALVGIVVGITQLLEYREKRREGKGTPTSLPSSPSDPAIPPSPTATEAVPSKPTAQRHNLPAPATVLIGRDRELAELRALLARNDVRLVTLTGPGGTGKTRLALQLGLNLLDDSSKTQHLVFENGVYWVALGDVTDAGLVAPTIAQALGLREASGHSLLETLKTYLQDKQLLLLLDNFEQLMPAVSLISELLAAAPGLKVVVTSREVLHLNGEHEFAVQSLPVPEPDPLPALEELSKFGAVELFVTRAQSVKSNFALTDENALAIAEICKQLDGMPLAIELAAARIKILSSAMILSQLRVNGLNVLSGGARDLPSRQQTLRNTLAWSYELLNDKEQKLFRRFGVFSGGASLEAITAVCAGEEIVGQEILDLLESLLNKSLLQQREQQGAPRFVMLETMREFMLEKLEASKEPGLIRERHLDFFVGFGELADKKIKSAERPEWTRHVEMERENLRAALGYSINAGGERGLRLVGALSRFWQLRGYFSEGREWAEKIVASNRDRRDNLMADALITIAVLELWQGEPTSFSKDLQEGLELSQEIGYPHGRAEALEWSAIRKFWRGEAVAAVSMFDESVRLFRGTPDRWGLANALGWQGWAYMDAGDEDLAYKCWEECRSLLQSGDRWSIALPLHGFAQIAIRKGDYSGAHEYASESLELFREAGDTIGVMILTNTLGDIARLRGNYAEAESWYQESLSSREVGGMDKMIKNAKLGFAMLRLGKIRQAKQLSETTLAFACQIPHAETIALCLAGLAGVALADEQLERAAQLLGATGALLESSGTRLEPADRNEYESEIAQLHAQLDNTAFTRAWEDGRSLTLEQAIALAKQE